MSSCYSYNKQKTPYCGSEALLDLAHTYFSASSRTPQYPHYSPFFFKYLFIIVIAVLGLELMAFPFSHSISPIFVKGFSR
jgi:hypothetical protein